MRYMDKKYGLGSTKDICGKKTKKQKGGKRKIKQKNNFYIILTTLKNHLMFTLIKIQMILFL